MATLVRFVYDKDSGEVVAVFPQLKYNRKLYGERMLVCYAHIGQHSSCVKDWAYDKNRPLATPQQYAELKKELENIGYKLKVCGK